MRKILLIMLIVILSGCSGDDEKTVSQNNETLVFGKSNKVSILSDKDWRVVPSDDLELYLVGRGKHEIEFEFLPMDGGFDKKCDIIINAYRGKKNFAIDSKSEISVDSIPSLFVILEYVEYEESFTENLYFVPQKDKILLIKVKAPITDFDSVFVEDILDTLTILNKVKDVNKKATERPLFFPEKVLQKIEGFHKVSTLSADIIKKEMAVFEGMIGLDREFKKTKEFSIFKKRKKLELKGILKANGFKSLGDFEDRINKSIAALMVINYTAEFKDNVSGVEMNIVKELVVRNKLSYEDIKVVYSNYKEVLELERKMRL